MDLEMQYSLDKAMKMGNHMDWLELLMKLDTSTRGTLAMGKGMDLEDILKIWAHKLDGGIMINSKVMVILFG